MECALLENAQDGESMTDLNGRESGASHESGDAEIGPGGLPVISLATKYIDWIEEGRRRMYSIITGENTAAIDFFPQHLPMVVTYSGEKVFPFNCGNKGVGFIPKAEYLEEFVDLFKDVHERSRHKPWRESLRDRIETVSSFYFARDKIDFRALSTLEIFERTTFDNLKKNPIASLLFTGHSPEYISFQLNCAAEIIEPDDPRYEFIELSRTMFEYDRFHITQPQFRYAYIFWISELIDKTPFRVVDRKSAVAKVETAMPWNEAALAAVSRAPGMIQEYIRASVEQYARSRGYDEVTLEIVREARESLM